MGAINYFTSDYITMGVRPYDFWDFKNDEDFLSDAKEYDVVNIDDYIYATISDYYADDYDNVKAILDKYYFEYYHVTIKNGYYEGFTVDIENNYPLCYDTWEDRREAQKEVTQIKTMLHELADIGLVACYPSWCTGYSDYSNTLNEIERAITEMRDEIDNTPTWRQYNKECS